VRKIILLLLILVSASASASQGGGWHSSGGELFGDEKNPWFVSNTTEVKYCVKVDTASVNASPDTVRRLIADAFQYWKGEFSRSIQLPKGHVAIATQNFSEVDCALKIADIDFLIGYGTLDSDQVGHLVDPSKYVGVTVRTDYDTVNLRGKGFVYIASDFGPHSYMTADLRKYTLLPDAWKKEPLLFYAILHELGHVFGLPHTGSGLMSEVFLEQLLNLNIYEAFLKEPVESFFFPNRYLDSCALLTGEQKVWFGADLDTRCLRLEMANAYGGPITVYAKGASPTAAWKRVGQFTKNEVNLFDIRHHPAVLLALPDDQKVFTPQQADFRSFMVGGMFYEAGADASYLADGSPIPHTAYLSLTPMSLHATGVIKGQAKTVFNYNSWIATKLYLPASQ
jgi:hypothetical protein